MKLTTFYNLASQWIAAQHALSVASFLQLDLTVSASLNTSVAPPINDEPVLCPLADIGGVLRLRAVKG